MKNNYFLVAACSILFSISLPASAGTVEVLHFWSSGGEAAALDILKNQVKNDGHTWSDFVVVGGGGENADAQLQARVISGNPPAAAQIKGLNIQRWARLGFLENIDAIAKEQSWNSKLPPVVSDAMKFDGHYVAVPVNVHRTNWFWASKTLLDSLNITPPKTWDEFDAAAIKIANAGYQVIAQGDQTWQQATLFEAVALSVGGADFYKSAFVDHDLSIMKGPTMIATFERYYKLLDYMTLNSNKPDWNIATEAVINGEAAFQFMGDWAKGEFAREGKVAQKDYYCIAVPGTENKFLFNIDSFAIFHLKGEAAKNKSAQEALVRNIMSDEFQVAFNLSKGSIPARTDRSLTEFDYCAQQSMAEFLTASNTGQLMPSIAHGMATTGTVSSYFSDKLGEITKERPEPREAARELAKAIRFGQYVIK